MTSIRGRLALALTVALALLLGAGGWVLYATMKRGLEERHRKEVEAEAIAVARCVNFENGAIELILPETLVTEFSRADGPAYYEIVDADGRALAASPSLGGRRIRADGRRPEGGEFARLPLPDGRSGLVAIVQVEPETEDEHAVAAHGPLFAIVADAEGDVIETLGHLRTTILVVVLASILGVVGIVNWALRRELKPLERMAAEAQRIDGSSLDRRFETGTLPAELGPIRDRLNDLLARLESSFARETRFNASVAHELRTPIAELRAMTEVALRWPDERETARVLRDALSIAERMQALVNALLLLRRVESGHEGLDRRSVDLGQALAAAVARAEVAARARGVSVTLDLLEPIVVDSEPMLMAMLLDNWLANAVEYAPRGSCVAVEARRTGTTFALSVSNDAPHLSSADLERMFEPFWRKDAARADAAHSGLGLALTQSIAGVLGADVDVRLEDGARLVLSLSGTGPSSPARVS